MDANEKVGDSNDGGGKQGMDKGGVLSAATGMLGGGTVAAVVTGGGGFGIAAGGTAFGLAGLAGAAVATGGTALAGAAAAYGIYKTGSLALKSPPGKYAKKQARNLIKQKPWRRRRE